ncbi:hypothetical protein ACVWW4_000411 [Bradyrhizobium sp. LB7.1]
MFPELSKAEGPAMEDTCELPTGIAICVVPCHDTCKVAIMADG